MVSIETMNRYSRTSRNLHCYFACELINLNTFNYRIMNTPLITWSCIVGLLILLVIVRTTHSLISNNSRKHRFITFGSEREEFFIPGDPVDEEDYDYE